MIESFQLGLLRFHRAESAYARLNLVYLSYQRESAAEGIPSDMAFNLSKVSPDSYGAHLHVTNVSHLVYSTTLFDTFLNDTTTFLFLLHPESIGKWSGRDPAALPGCP